MIDDFIAYYIGAIIQYSTLSNVVGFASCRAHGHLHILCN